MSKKNNVQLVTFFIAFSALAIASITMGVVIGQIGNGQTRESLALYHEECYESHYESTEKLVLMNGSETMDSIGKKYVLVHEATNEGVENWTLRDKDNIRIIYQQLYRNVTTLEVCDSYVLVRNATRNE